MQQLAKDEQGNVWDTSTNPPRLVQAAGGGQSQTVGTPDPRVAQERALKDLAIQAAARNAARDPVKDQREDARAHRDELEWNATHNPDGSPKSKAVAMKPLRGGDGDKLETQVGIYGALKDAVGAFKDDFAGNTMTGEMENWAQGLLGTGTPHQREWWANFRSTDNVIRNQLYGASLTAGEKQAYDQTTINPSMKPDVIKERLAKREELVRKALTRKVARFKAGGYNPAEIDAATGEFGADLTPDYKPAPASKDRLPGAAPPTGDGRLGADEMVHFNGDDKPITGKRMSSQQENEIVAAIRSGDEGQAVALLGKYGPGPVGPSEIASIRATIKQVRKNPTTPVSFNYGKVDTYAQTEADRKRFGDHLPQAMDERANAGGLDVSVRSGTNGLTAGLADYLAAAGGMVNGRGFTDNLKRQKALSEADARLHPNNTMISNIVGGAGGAALTEGAAGALLPARLATTWTPRIADMAYGAVSGATNAAPGGEGTGALTGAFAGSVGGVAGRGVTRGAAGAVGGVRNAAIDELQTRGIPLTVGQLVSQSGRVGRVIKSAEDAMTSLPVVGNMISARRLEGLRGFNRAAVDEALAPIGQQAVDTGGEESIARARDLVSQAYDNTLSGVRMTGDAPFVNDMQGVFGRAQRLPATMADNADYTLNTRVGESFDPQGTLTGNAYQQSMRGLRRDASAVRNQPYGHDFGAVTREAEQALEALAARQAPEVVPGLARANEAYGRVGILRDAVNAARNGSRSGEGGVFMPSQLSDAASRNARRFGGTQATPDAPFYQLNQAARDVLPSRVPDSGTTGRLLTGLALTGAGTGGAEYAAGGNGSVSESTAGTLALLAALGTRRGQQALAATLSRRPNALRNAADLIARNQRWGGVIGAGTTVPLLTSP
jgi:hypothetical protein